jgi:phospholipid transport system substrate-binding protein
MPAREVGGRWPHAPARVLGLLLAGLLCALPASSPAADGETPRAIVTAITNNALAVLAKSDLSTDEKRRQLETVVYANVDFEVVSRLVLARNWTRFSEAERAEFTREFKAHLSRTYGRNIDNYKNERVEILSDRAEARDDWTVRTRVQRDSDAILVDYRLRATDGTWRIIDIIVEGVSLVANFRSQFQEIVAQDGPAQLLKMLRDKNIVSQPIAG